MYTAEMIDDMDAQSAQEAFDAMAQEYFGTASWKTEFARIIGATPRSVQAWFTPDNKPRVWAFLMLQALIEVREARKHLQGITSALDFARGSGDAL